VQIVERSILARLRDRSFFSLREANEAVSELLAELNSKPFQKLSGSRQSTFVELEKALLQPLPNEPYNVASWKKAKVNIDYHIEVNGHYYSVPYQHARHEVEIRLSEATIEVFHQGKRIASHLRVVDTPRNKGRHTTVAEHMPAAHQRHADWSPARLIGWAEKTGEHTALVVTHILESRPHPEQGFRSCLGIMRLGKLYGDARLESACCRAHRLRSYSYKSVQSILKHGLDAQPLEPEPLPDTPTTHEHRNVRGADYYRREAEPC
jgi:transposase